MNGKIYLRNMVFYAFHGVYEFERELGQRFYVDVEMTADFSKGSRTDDLKDAVDYVGVYSKAKEIVENSRSQLMESVVLSIADEVLAMSPLIKEVKINIRKPSVPLNGVLDCVEVELSKTREG